MGWCARGSKGRSRTKSRSCTSRLSKRFQMTFRRTCLSHWPRSVTGCERRGCPMSRYGLCFVRDTPQSERQAMLKQPPHILVTTPESLYLILTSERARDMLRSVRTVIVDEIHAVARDKRGSHLALSLARLDALIGKRPQRIGLSATQRPIEEIAQFLVGTGQPAPTIVDAGHIRRLDLELEIPSSPLEAVMSAEVWEEVNTRIAELITQHRTTLVFVNTRRLAERLTMH